MAGYFTFDPSAFRIQFPAFANNPPYSDALLQMYWEQAICTILNNNFGSLINDCKFLALNLLTAHIAAINALLASGQTPHILTSASIDKIKLTVDPPPKSNQFIWWLDTTPYGMQLAAMLKGRSVGGFAIAGGLSERSSFRKSYGVFGPCQ